MCQSWKLRTWAGAASWNPRVRWAAFTGVADVRHLFHESLISFFTPLLSGVRDWFPSLRAGEGELIIENKWSVLLPPHQPLTTAAAGQWSVDGSGGIKTDSWSATGSNSPQCSKDSHFQAFNNDLRCLQIAYIPYLSTFFGKLYKRKNMWPSKGHHVNSRYFEACDITSSRDGITRWEQEWYLCPHSWGDRLQLQIHQLMLQLFPHKLANNIDCLVEVKWPDGFYKQRNADYSNSRWSHH